MNILRIRISNYFLIKLFSRITPAGWIEYMARIKAILIVRLAIKSVPAYREFLLSQNQKLTNIKGKKEFLSLSVTNKTDYFFKYGFEKTLLEKSYSNAYYLEQSGNYSYQSGLTFWPKFGSEEKGALANMELFYRYFYNSHKEKTLVIVAFTSGMWSAAERASYFGKQLAARKRLKLTVASPGANKETVIEIVKKTAHFYKKVILLGSPFYLREIIEYGETRGIRWRDYDINLLSSADGFSEDWREYILSKISPSKTSPLITTKILSGFGITEKISSIGIETSLSILTRRLAWRDQNLKTSLFGEDNFLPMIFQYNPIMNYLEIENQELIMTSLAEQPLLRYNTKDLAKIMSYKDVITALKKFGYNPKELLLSAGYKEILPLPFLFIFGRNNNMIKLKTIFFYVEDIKAYLAHPDLIRSNTGNFKIEKVTAENMDERLRLSIELREDVELTQELAKKYEDIYMSDLPPVKLCLKKIGGDPKNFAPILEFSKKGTPPFSPKENPKFYYLRRES